MLHSGGRRPVGLRPGRVQMFDDSKRLDKLESDMANVGKFQEAVRKNFESLQKYQDGIGKDFETINKNFQDIWKRLDGLEKSMKAVEAKVKKIK
jgi:uncharacterized protein YaaN involved in tellurite resistance